MIPVVPVTVSTRPPRIIKRETVTNVGRRGYKVGRRIAGEDPGGCRVYGQIASVGSAYIVVDWDRDPFPDDAA